MRIQTEESNLKRSLAGQKQQSARKKQKHKFEDIVAEALNGMTIPGHGKTDVIANGVNYSVKNCKVIQFLMRRLNPTIQEWGENHPITNHTRATSICWSAKWKNGEDISPYYDNVIKATSELASWLNEDKSNIEALLRWVMTANGEIEMFADGCLEVDKVYLYSAEDVINELMKNEFKIYPTQRQVSINVVAPWMRRGSYKLMSIEPRTDKNNYGATNYRTDSKNFVNHMRSSIDDVKIALL
jgi:hypothetical protein